MDDKLTANSADRMASDGFERIEAATPLTRLHFFDGKFLRADALTTEQDYYRMLVRLSNLAGGWGAVYGFGVKMQGAELLVSDGFATTPKGNLVLLNGPVNVPISTLIERSAPPPKTPAPAETNARIAAEFGTCVERAPAPDTVAPGDGYYVITVGPWARMCDNEEVYGKLCEDACVTDTQKRYWREGVVIRLRPISLALPTSTTVTFGDVHLRNRVASAYFAREPWLTPPTISGAGLRGNVWCDPAQVSMADEVPIGILARSGTTAKFVDAWTARRERMDTQARAYWQGRMMMRPWNVFIGQILQFQCQLPSVFRGDGTLVPIDDDCVRLRQALTNSVKQIDVLRGRYERSSQKLREFVGATHKEAASVALDESAKDIQELRISLGTIDSSIGTYIANDLLLKGGFVELPPAGYLPVVPGDILVNEQMRRMFGEGVNLHFCTARPDYIAHAVEEAQHMERISLTRGLDDPTRKEEVQIFVPYGEILAQQDAATYWIVNMDPSVVDYFNASIGVRVDTDKPEPTEPAVARANDSSMVGIARTASVAGDGASLTLVCAAEQVNQRATRVALVGSDNPDLPRVLVLYLDLQIDRDPFAAAPKDVLKMSVELRNLESVKNAESGAMGLNGNVATGNGTLTIQQVAPSPSGTLAIALASMRVSRQVISDTPTPVIDDLVVDVLLQFERSGNAQAGMVTLLPLGPAERPVIRNAVLKTVPWVATWDGAPRVAELTLGRPDTQLIGNPLSGPVEFRAGLGPAERIADRIAVGRSETVSRFVTMAETAPPLAADVRSAAMDTLIAIQAKTTDTRFLERATDRLFPGPASTTGNRIRATRDWVMFRRERKAICDAAPPPPEPKPTPKPKQSYQTWFVVFDNEDIAKKFQIALRDEQTPAKMPVNATAIDVLQFAADSTSSDQTPEQILAGWPLIPNADLALAVVWPRGSTSDEFRLNNLRTLSVVAAVESQLPPAPRFVVVSPVAAPEGLGNSAFDGGILLVGVHKPLPLRLVHRAFFVEAGEEEIRRLNILLSNDPKNFLGAISQLLHKFVEFMGPDNPNKEEFSTLHDLHAAVVRPPQVITETWLLVAEKAPDEASVVCEYVKMYVPLENAKGVRKVAIADFEDGAMSASVSFLGKRHDKAPMRKTPGKRPSKPVKRPG